MEKSSGVQEQKILTIKHMQCNSRIWRYQNMFLTKIVMQSNYCLYFFFVFGKNTESYVHVNAKQFLKALKIWKSNYMLCFKRPLQKEFYMRNIFWSYSKFSRFCYYFKDFYIENCSFWVINYQLAELSLNAYSPYQKIKIRFFKKWIVLVS